MKVIAFSDWAASSQWYERSHVGIGNSETDVEGRDEH